MGVRDFKKSTVKDGYLKRHTREPVFCVETAGGRLSTNPIRISTPENKWTGLRSPLCGLHERGARGRDTSSVANLLSDGGWGAQSSIALRGLAAHSQVDCRVCGTNRQLRSGNEPGLGTLVRQEVAGGTAGHYTAS